MTIILTIRKTFSGKTRTKMKAVKTIKTTTQPGIIIFYLENFKSGEYANDNTNCGIDTNFDDKEDNEDENDENRI